MSKRDYSIFDIHHCACGGCAMPPVGGETQRLECDMCGMAGPIGETPEQAVRLWNLVMGVLRPMWRHIEDTARLTE